MRIPQAGFQGTIATVLAGDVCTRCTPRTDLGEGAVGGGRAGDDGGWDGTELYTRATLFADVSWEWSSLYIKVWTTTST